MLKFLLPAKYRMSSVNDSRVMSVCPKYGTASYDSQDMVGLIKGTRRRQ